MNGPDVEGVLFAHRIVHDAFSPYCACGQWRDKRDDGTGHAAHAAAAVNAEVRAWLESEGAANAAQVGVHAIESCEPDPSVEQYAAPVLAALAAQVAPSRVPGEGP